MNRKNIWRKFAGKGYYIALILCAVAIGITGYLYYRNANAEPRINAPTGLVDADPADPNIQAMATQPSGTLPGATQPQASGEDSRKPLKTALPLQGQTVADYAMDCLSYNATTRDWRVHNGVDIAADAGTVVCAAADGEVYTVYRDETMGTTVVIRHEGGYVTRYSSLDSQPAVEPGDSVKLGQAIGYVGCSALLESALGDHVHFSVTRNDEPVDPAEFLELD